MLDTESAKYFYDSLSVLLTDDLALREKLLKYYAIYKEVLNKILEKESRAFSSYFAKTVFVIDNYQVPENITSVLKKFRQHASSSSRSRNYNVGKYSLDCGAVAIAKLVNYFSEIEIPSNILYVIDNFDERESNKYFSPAPVKIEEIRCVVVEKAKSKNEIPELKCVSEDFGTIVIQLNPPWVDMYDFVWENSVVNFMNINSVDKEKQIFKTISTSLIVLEPDYLMDATDLTDCFQNSGVNPNIYFLKKFCNSTVNESMVAGNLINSCLDELLNNPEIQFEDIYDKALMLKPLQIFVLALKNKNSVKEIRDKVAKHFENLQKTVKQIEHEIISVEPSFISPKYGLQGRLDVLLEYFDNPKQKDIIELKSGKGPDSSALINTFDGKKTNSVVWNNQLAQTTCYNLMLDSTFPDRFGTSSILYSSVLENAMRNTENIHQKKQEVLWVRNKVVGIEHQFRVGNHSILDTFNENNFGIRPPYFNDNLKEFSDKYSTADAIVKEYFQNFLTFILNEMSSAKVGGNNDSKGFSALWLENIDEKKEDYSVLRNLKLNPDESDMDAMYLSFESKNEELQLSSFRKGDMIILIQEYEDGTSNIWNNQLLKATIKEISEKKIRISLRNKLFDKRILKSDSTWIIETDYIDSTNKKLYNSIYELLRADSIKQKLILGLKEPDSIGEIDTDTQGLNENQSEVVRKAVSSKNYFLIQGPPGTGKTSFVLKSIVENIYKSTAGNLLVMAYTNRAVDEICSALKTIDGNFSFLRTGSKESSEHSDILISSLSETVTTRELFIKVRDTRVIVSTVSSVISNPEIMNLKEFHTAIVDEASQILEPQIVGILANVNRFILIGDEKQLPAVVTQNPINLNVNSELLNSINIRNLGVSLFERLLICCTKNGWSNAYGLLKHQARMHMKIQEFPNKYFYDNKLEIFADNEWQFSEKSIFSEYKNDIAFSTLSKNRIVFIESEIETGKKVNYSEVKIAVNLARKIKDIYADKFNETTLGIICPFRAQCAEIYRQMDKELRKQVMVDTVERFQGSEREIIIISFAVNYEHQLRTMQSLTDNGDILIDRKLNVAMTRAKEYLIFLGNSEILSRSTIYNNLIEFVKEKEAYIKYI